MPSYVLPSCSDIAANASRENFNPQTPLQDECKCKANKDANDVHLCRTRRRARKFTLRTCAYVTQARSAPPLGRERARCQHMSFPLALPRARASLLLPSCAAQARCTASGCASYKCAERHHVGGDGAHSERLHASRLRPARQRHECQPHPLARLPACFPLAPQRAVALATRLPHCANRTPMS